MKRVFPIGSVSGLAYAKTPKPTGKGNPELANIHFLLSESLAMSSLFRNYTEKNRIIGGSVDTEF